jgi:hypothetical protein
MPMEHEFSWCLRTLTTRKVTLPEHFQTFKGTNATVPFLENVFAMAFKPKAPVSAPI